MVRTRFAPSPTGYMHIGNLRTALYAYLFARHSQGSFILRIEDTDQKRNVPEALQVIYNSLRLAQIDYNEGPDKDGGFGPYTQSERKAIYHRYIEELIARDGAYRCFCSGSKTAGETEASEQFNAQPERRDPCRTLSPEAVRARLKAGEPFVVRQKIPDQGVTAFVDHVYGTITVSNTELDDQVLVKSDGFPTYNFANVVDDHLMQISHVIRGVEYLSSTPKYNLLYQSFGWEIPEYVHLPHIIKENGKKLSKREGDASFEDLLAQGYLPAAVVNYIALLGWNPGDEREFFTIDGLIEAFDIDRINKSSAAFSLVKLDWLNGQHIRALPLESFHVLAQPFYPAEVAARLDTFKISRIIQPRLVRLNEIPVMIAFLDALPAYSSELFMHTKSKSSLETSRLVLENAIPRLAGLAQWDNLSLQESLKVLGGEFGLKTGTVMWPVRIALSGLETTPGGATEIAEILGKDEGLARLHKALSVLQAA